MRSTSGSRSEDDDSEEGGLTRFIFSESFRLSPSMLLPSAPLPPIRKTSQSSNRREMCSFEKESGKNGSGYEEDTREREELRSKGKSCKASLLYPTEGDKKKGSLGLPLIPPIRRAVSPDVGSAAGSLQSSLQLDVQESQEMRSTSGSRSEDDDSEEGGLPLSQAKGTDRPTSPGHMSDEDLRDSSGKVRVKDRDEQTSFPYCLAPNVTDNHSLPFLRDGDSPGNIFAF
ncbi:uncharacterized protein LOC111943553 [Cyanistes caeruleus]|uniref:uncharacterized protein LOC111943553 n=1 Tax=Cyanistes caeruleus TaxID=156563 RepID=UPI000CDB0FD6|nr:uncharacterized protein LOC111943553 [Cyanistes caeruleus]